MSNKNQPSDVQTTPEPPKLIKTKAKRKDISDNIRNSLTEFIKSEILDDSETSNNTSESQQYTLEKYSAFVHIVTECETGTEWFVFDDGYVTEPIAKHISSILGKSSISRYLVIPDKDGPTVIIERNQLRENFGAIMTLAVVATEDEDLYNFLTAYVVREDFAVDDLESKADITPVDVYAYIVKSRINDKVLYFNDADVYTSRNLSIMDSDPEDDPRVYVVRPMEQPPFMNIIIPVTTYSDRTIVPKLMSHRIVLRKSYKFDELGFRTPSEEEIEQRISENKQYINNYEMYREYDGVGLVPSFFGPKEVYMKGRVIVDSAALFYVSPDELSEVYNCVGMFSGGLSHTSTVGEHSVGECGTDVYMSMSKFEPCYDLDKKQWFLGQRDSLNDITFRKDAFEKLQMNEDKKQIIKKICSNKHNAVQNIDFIDGKGGGNIFLLHGVPGTGKTLTAEAISELLESPLYKVNISEYEGMRALENGIIQALRYAERWDATLLIDEADVALERRDSNNIERNAIVAVFLRLIEYYTGTMFLTSNRASEFDEAFKSRITFAIHYERPSKEVRYHIWSNILMNLKGNVSNNDIIQLANNDLNGRQIKNIITTSSYMSDDGSILVDNLNIVMKQTLEFDEFLNKRRT